MKPRVLWIEDSARLELRNLAAPVYSSGRFDFNLAEDVTSAVNLLKTSSFDAVIVDIRLPPGADPYWQYLYKHAGADKVNAQLGLKLIKWLVSGDKSIYPESPPEGMLATRIGVFTVEAWEDVHYQLESFGISVFQQKTTGLPDNILINLFEKIISQSSRG